MKTNDLKKGVRVQLKNGWFGTVADNKKGNIRMVEVEGIYTEIGSVYSHDIVSYRDTSGSFVPVDHTPAQKSMESRVAAFGF